MKNLIPRLIGMYLNILGVLAPRLAGKKGFMIFCRPFRPTLNPKQLEFLNSAERFTIEREGRTVQGYKWGSGEKKILFIHGWQSHTYRWKAYIEALSKDDHTIYAFDAPGHGLSPGNFLSLPVYSEMIEALVDKVGNIDTAVTHSMGSFSLLYSFHRKNELPIQSIVLMASPGEAKEFVNVFRSTLKLSDRTVKAVLEYFVWKYKVMPAYFSALKFSEKVTANALLIHDEGDDEASYEYVVGLSKVLKNARLVTTKGLGHNLKSPAIVKEVVDFISVRQEVDAD
jgi:pimeloyl-ACP methyl ester carboxylesterase